MEDIMLDTMFEIPARSDIKKCIITKEAVEKKIEPRIITDSENKDFVEDEKKLA